MSFRLAKQFFRHQRLKRAGIVAELDVHAIAPGGLRGGWTVHPDVLDSSSIVYAFGVGSNIEWDKEMCRRFGLTLHAFDPTPRAISWIRSQSLPDNLHFHEYGIAAHDGVVNFYPPRRSTSYNFSPIDRDGRVQSDGRIEAPVRRLGTIMRELGHTRVDVLKVDIEGGEYDVIHDFLGEKLDVGQLLVEFHHNYRTVPFERTVDTVNALKKAGYRIFHISPRGYEFSFIRR